jgi:magnesium transporter
MGGMSEFSMMTQGIPWPLAYGGFLLGAGLIGVMTFLILKQLERRQ